MEFIIFKFRIENETIHPIKSIIIDSTHHKS